MENQQVLLPLLFHAPHTWSFIENARIPSPLWGIMVHHGSSERKDCLVRVRYISVGIPCLPKVQIDEFCLSESNGQRLAWTPLVIQNQFPTHSYCSSIFEGNTAYGGDIAYVWGPEESLSCRLSPPHFPDTGPLAGIHDILARPVAFQNSIDSPVSYP